MNIPVSELIVISLIPVVMISMETGGETAGLISIGARTTESFVGTWTNYSPTKFGVMSVEFVQNGTCQFHRGADGIVPCKWEETENGRAKIKVMESGRNEEFSAALSGDYIVIREPGRETPYVRAKTRAAYERQRQANGPSKYDLRWVFQPDRK